MSYSHTQAQRPDFRRVPPSHSDTGLLRRLAAALAVPVLALAAGVPLRSAHHLLPDADD